MEEQPNIEISEDFKTTLVKLFKFIQNQLKIKSVPGLILKHNPENAQQMYAYTGYYDPEAKKITLFITDRHPVDILRSFAHEVIHHWQNENGKLIQSQTKLSRKYAQEDQNLRQMEKQAYLLGNMLFRDFEDNERYGN